MPSTFNHINLAEQAALGSLTTPIIANGAVTAAKLGTVASLILQDITYTAVNGGTTGNSITVQYIEDGIAGLETVNVTGSAIVVHIGNHTVLGSTATQVQTVLLSSVAVSLLVTSVISGTGSNIQLAIGPVSLTGGSTGATGVSSIHADSNPNITGAVQLVSGANITLSQSGNAITISNGETPITTGNLTETVSSVLTITGGTNAVIGSGTTIDVKQSSTSQSGYLSNTDWNTFNTKQPAGNYITALTGDVTATGPGSVATSVISVGGSTAANIHTSQLATAAATAADTASTLVLRDSSGNFAAGTITASLTGHSSLDLALSGGTMSGAIGMNGDPDSSALLDMQSITQGLLPPRMTTTQRNAIQIISFASQQVSMFNATTFLAGSTFTVNGTITLTEGIDWNVGGNDNTAASSLFTAINASPSLAGIVTAQNLNGHHFDVVSVVSGSAGNSITIQSSNDHLSVIGDAGLSAGPVDLSGGVLPPAEGLIVYDITLHQWIGWNSSSWAILG